MRNSKEAKAISAVARQYGVSEQEVRDEIQIAIDLAMADSDPKVQAYWANIPRKGKKPTPEEVIIFISKMIKDEMKK